MKELTTQDRALIGEAHATIEQNYDGKDFKHTVGAALRCKNGEIYTGINAYTLHGPCAETIAIGKALTSGEREFDCIVAVAIRENDGFEVLPPCGNCRQTLFDYMPDCEVIIKTESGLKKLPARELLPYPYVREDA